MIVADIIFVFGCPMIVTDNIIVCSGCPMIVADNIILVFRLSYDRCC